MQEVCPWFPDQGSIDLDLWEQVGINLKKKNKQGEKIPTSTLVTWSLICMALCPLYVSPSQEHKEEVEGPSAPLLPSMWCMSFKTLSKDP